MAADGRLSPWYSTPALALRMPTHFIVLPPLQPFQIMDREAARRMLSRMQQLLDSKQLLTATTHASIDLGGKAAPAELQAALLGLVVRLAPNLEVLELSGVHGQCPLRALLGLPRLRELDVRIWGEGDACPAYRCVQGGVCCCLLQCTCVFVCLHGLNPLNPFRGCLQRVCSSRCMPIGVLLGLVCSWQPEPAPAAPHPLPYAVTYTS